MIKPRWYQQEAVDAFKQDAKDHPLASHVLTLPTGAGKTVVMAMIIDWIINSGGRVVVLARTKELVQQNHDTFCRMFPEHEQLAGMFCASLNKRSAGAPVLFASIQSVANKPLLLGRRKLVIVDECHQVPDKEETQYQKFLKAMRGMDPKCKMLGLTASPYRLDGGIVFGPGRQFDRMTYVVPLSVLINENYITPPKTLKTTEIDLSQVRKKGQDFDQQQAAKAFMGNSVTGEMVAAADAKGCKSILVFCSSVAHAESVQEELEIMGEECRLVTGETLPLERDSSIADFAARRVRWMVNVEVLTTGFDAPCVDMVAVARMTESPGLFLQMVGRGFRLFEGKEYCWIMDYGGNIERHGPVNSDKYGMQTIKVPSKVPGEPPQRVCTHCFHICHAAARECPNCETEFPPNPKQFVATQQDIVEEPKWLNVAGVQYLRNVGKELPEGGKKPDTLRIQYRCEDDTAVMGKRWVSEWVCIEHEGWAGKKASEWWKQHSRNDVPQTIYEALEIINNIGIGQPTKLKVVRDGKYDRVLDREMGEIPEPQPIDWGSEEDVPF